MSLRIHRFTAMAVASATVATLALSARPAAANVEAGATVGGHIFSVNNELGVPDSNDATSLRDSVLFGIRLGYYFSDLLGVEGELGLIPTESRQMVFDVWALTYRAQLVAQFLAEKPENKFIPFVLAGIGSTNVVSSGNEDIITIDGDEMVYLGAGVKYRIGKVWGLRFDARMMFPPSSDTEFAAVDYEGLLSVYHEWGRKQAVKVVPVEIGDKDGDKFKDDVDQCIDDPEDYDSYKDDDGCPEPDNDNDGILDVAPDECLLDPEDPDQWEDADGCPEPDNDNDGLLDGNDACPIEAEDPDQWVDEDGCPEPDNDLDGFLDGADGCPNEAETPNGYQDEDGCPDDVPTALKEFTGVIKGITFQVDSEKINKSSNKILNATVKILTEYPDTKLEIQGHTDDTGDEAYNVDLSQRRAEAVKAYLVKEGIAEDRLVAKGYGKSVPLDDRTTKGARAKNRRVEFKLITQGGVPTP